MKRTISNADFFKEAHDFVKNGKNVYICPTGNSMLPFLHGGKDKIQLSPYRPDELKKGTVVFFKYKNQYAVHRIISEKNGVFNIQGDGNLTKEWVEKDAIIAVMKYICRPNGKVIDCNNFWYRFCTNCWIALRPIRKQLLWLYKLPRRIKRKVKTQDKQK